MKGNSAIEKSGGRRVARPLSVIARLIKAERDAAEGDSKQHWTKVGELLVEAFAHFSGNWTEFKQWFSAENFDFGFQPARARMLALSKLEKDRARYSERPSMREIERDSYRRPEDEIREKVRKSVDMSRRIMEQAATKRNEEDAIRKLAIQIVDMGFKVLAAKFHPDKRGGSHEAMRRLNAARALIKSYLG